MASWWVYCRIYDHWLWILEHIMVNRWWKHNIHENRDVYNPRIYSKPENIIFCTHWLMDVDGTTLNKGKCHGRTSRWNYQSYTKPGTSLLFYLPKQHRYHLQQSQEWIVYTLGFKCTLPIVLRLFLGSQLFLWLEYIILHPDYMMI